MSKIDEYNKQSQITRNVITQLRHAQGLKYDGTKQGGNDKAYCKFVANRIFDSDIPIYFHASYGYYGSSGAYSACDDTVKQYLYRALNDYTPKIIQQCIMYAQQDEERALEACKKEAENILKLIDEYKNK